jgi:16S rRNA (uracil1498-N3)-methyltransferase
LLSSVLRSLEPKSQVGFKTTRTYRFILSFKADLIASSNHPSLVGSTIRFSNNNLHHLKNVLRLKPTDTLEAMDSDSSRSFICKLVSIEDKQAYAEILQEAEPAKLTEISLLVAIVKPKKCDLIVEKCVELGIKKILFFRAERSQGKLNETKKEEKIARFERISNEALKQSGLSNQRCEIDILDSLEAALVKAHQESSTRETNTEWRVLLHPNEKQYNILKATLGTIENLSNYRALSKHNSLLENTVLNAESYLIIGPEGGLTDAELELASRYNYLHASLGARVLKTETAAISAVSIIRFLREAF